VIAHEGNLADLRGLFRVEAVAHHAGTSSVVRWLSVR
jgi:hypothetical protein